MNRWLLFAHLISAVVWVGGMFFAYVALRPATLETLQAPQRLPLWSATLRRFFFWVWLAVLVLASTGALMIVQLGGLASVPRPVHVMLAVGAVMIAIFAYVFFFPYRKLVRHAALLDWQEAGRALSQIRLLVAVNLVLGLLNLAAIRVL